MTQDDGRTGSTASSVVEWRLTGVRRWLPVFVLACFVVEAVLRLVEVAGDGATTVGAAVGLVVTLLGVLFAATMVVVAWRARVRLVETGIEVRRGRRRLIPYERVTRVYRDRFASGGATLLLEGDAKVVLPAPVSGLGVGSPEVDDAVEQIRARLPAGR